MFFHNKGLQFESSCDKPDPVFAKQLQEVLGGQWGEISVMMTYLLQGWSCRMPGKFKDLLLDIGTEEIAHVEMLSTLIAKLLEGAPAGTQESIADADAGVAAVLGGMNPQHAVVSGLGPQAADSVGVPWNGRYAVSSGNLLADFRYNVTAESQGRMQVARLYNMTNDKGVHDTLSFLLARDTMHQNQWLAAIAELEEAGIEETPVPSGPPEKQQYEPHSYTHWPLTEGSTAPEGRWASGPSIDGKGTFSVVEAPQPLGPVPAPPKDAPRLYAKGNDGGEGVVSKVVDKLT